MKFGVFTNGCWQLDGKKISVEGKYSHKSERTRAPLLTRFCSRFSSYSGLRESRLDNPKVRTAFRILVYGYNSLTSTLQILLS